MGSHLGDLLSPGRRLILRKMKLSLVLLIIGVALVVSESETHNTQLEQIDEQLAKHRVERGVNEKKDVEKKNKKSRKKYKEPSKRNKSKKGVKGTKKNRNAIKGSKKIKREKQKVSQS